MLKTKLYTIYMGFMEERVQNGVSGGFMHAIFKPAVQLGAEIWTNPPHILPREAYYSSQVSRIYVASV